MDINNVTLIGNLVKKPEIRYAQSGLCIAKFTIGNNRYVNKENKANFFNIVCFGKIAELCEKYIDKGSRVAIAGSLDQQVYKNEQGQNIYRVNIIANTVQFLNSVRQREENNSDNVGDSQPEKVENDVYPDGDGIDELQELSTDSGFDKNLAY